MNPENSSIEKYVKFPLDLSTKQTKEFFKENNLDYLIESSNKNIPSYDLISSEPYKPDLLDLYRIYQFVTLNKRLTIMEFGSGWSTLILYYGINELKRKYEKEINFRRSNPFELFVLENEKKYLNITKKRINNFINERNSSCKVNFFFSNVNMTTYNGKIATEYENLPLCNPDFIYLDGPDQFNVQKKVNNINTNHIDMMPMSCDILKFEYFYTPGTIILVDGRSANSKFLKDNLKRNWLYKNLDKFNQHIFYLNDPPLGEHNLKQLQFYRN